MGKVGRCTASGSSLGAMAEGMRATTSKIPKRVKVPSSGLTVASTKASGGMASRTEPEPSGRLMASLAVENGKLGVACLTTKHSCLSLGCKSPLREFEQQQQYLRQDAHPMLLLLLPLLLLLWLLLLTGSPPAMN